MDEQEKLERLREIRLIVTEVLMFLAVVMLVGFLTLIVTGHAVNWRKIGTEEEVIERTGLVQIGSIPTGATIAIDGEVPLMLRTNGSRTMLTGDHTIKLSREGYDTWEKTVRVSEGLMYRLNYPRLFLKEREAEEVLVFEKDEVKYTTVSPNKEKMLVVHDGKTYLVELNATKPVLKPLYDEEVSDVEWSGNSERILATTAEGRVVLSVKNATEKAVLGEIISEVSSALKITDLKFETEAGERLLVLLSDKTLREIDVKAKTVSAAVATKVERFDNDGDRVTYMTQVTTDEEVEENQVRVIRVGAEESVLLWTTKSEGTKVLTMRYFQDTYFGVVDGEKLAVYYATSWPTAEASVTQIFEEELTGKVTKFEKRGKGMVFALELAEEDERTAEVFDIEAMQTTRFALAGTTGWIDEYLRYAVDGDGKLMVVDYDGLNRRALVESGVNAKRAVTISGNSRYLYYFTTDGKLVREKVN